MYLCSSENKEKYVYNIHLGLHAQNDLVGGKKHCIGQFQHRTEFEITQISFRSCCP